MPSVQALISNSFDGLTIPLVVPLDPKFPRTTYGEVTTTDLTTRELPDPNILYREANDLIPMKNSPVPKKDSLGTSF